MKNFIDGNWTDPKNGESLSKFDPCTGKEAYKVPNSTREDVEAAVYAAKARQPAWRAKGRVRRAEVLSDVVAALKNNVDLFTKLISLETGKHQNEAKAEVLESLHMLEYTVAQGRAECGQWLPSELPERDIAIIRKPKGVVGIISPWNFPMAIGGFWCAAPALLEGNAVVWKPSENTALVAEAVVKMYAEAGLPPGLLNLVHGGGVTGADLVKEDVDHICFTGSRDVGQYIRRVCAETWGKTCSLETGSKSAVIVFSDADVDFAVNACIPSAFKTTGQRCVSAGRLLVQRDRWGSFVDAFVAAARKITWGNPFQENAPYYGPLITEKQMHRVLRYNQMTLKHALLEGKCEEMDGGYYMSPHIYKAEWDNLALAVPLREEVFGPHVAIIPFDTVDEAINIYNDTPYGLSLGVITPDAVKARQCREGCEYGMAYWNNGCVGAESHVPFGGVKASGYGGASAAGTFDTTSHKVAWSSNYGEIGFPQGLK
jgi:aldehyde dehydrogenase (NAD+)